jgi:D-psicose/D-tagatose/L-ribulose 3-epimerase
MRLSISNIAWDVVEDDAVASLLSELSIDAIDVAPGKYFPQPEQAIEREIERVRRWWDDRGIAIVGMQALLFGTQGLNLFASDDVQQKMLKHLAAVCRIGAGLGAKHLVFGSPKNRDRTGLDDTTSLVRAVDFFRRLGDVAEAHSVTICLEPNPPRYGANFMTTSAETAEVVQQIGHSAIRMQLDTGALTINGESVAKLLSDHAGLIGHIHASEPDLVPLGDGTTDHRGIGCALTQALPNHTVTVEMLATVNEPHLDSIRRALNTAIDGYGNRQESRP